MVKFRVTPHPGEAQVLQGQNLARALYDIGADDDGAGGGGNVPVFLGIVLDESGSMEGQKLYSAKEALLRLLHQVPATDNVVIHITLFSDQAEELIQPMTGRALYQHWNSFQVASRTSARAGRPPWAAACALCWAPLAPIRNTSGAC